MGGGIGDLIISFALFSVFIYLFICLFIFLV